MRTQCAIYDLFRLFLSVVENFGVIKRFSSCVYFVGSQVHCRVGQPLNEQHAMRSNRVRNESNEDS